MDQYFDDKTTQRAISKGVSLTVAYLIGTKYEVLYDNNPEYRKQLEELTRNREASIIRLLCNIRSNIMLNYTNVDTLLRVDMKNLDRQELFSSDVKKLEKYEVYVVPDC